MGQIEVYKLLLNVKEPIPAREIAKKLNDNIDKIFKALRKMIKINEIDFIEIETSEALKKFNSKRRMRLYYLKENGYC